jgi:hypothetical protein
LTRTRLGQQWVNKSKVVELRHNAQARPASRDADPCRNAASRRLGLSRNWTPALSCATTTGRPSPTKHKFVMPIISATGLFDPQLLCRNAASTRPYWRVTVQQRRQAVKESKLLLRFSLITAFVFCVFGFLGQSTGPLFADGALAPKLVSYSPGDAIASPAGSAAATKTIKMACYAAGGRCTKDSDCCGGHCNPTRGRTFGGGGAYYCGK